MCILKLQNRRIESVRSVSVSYTHLDITALINPAGRNVLAVLVQTPQHPMANFASPTYICSGGWDWIPYVPGLNSGITDKVFLSNSGPVTLEDPWIRTLLPTNARADLVIAVTAKNNSSAQQEVTLKGVIQPGSIEFTQKISICLLYTSSAKSCRGTDR